MQPISESVIESLKRRNDPDPALSALALSYAETLDLNPGSLAEIGPKLFNVLVALESNGPEREQPHSRLADFRAKHG